MNTGNGREADLDELLDEDEASYVNQRRPRIRTAGVTAGQLSESRRNGMQFEVFNKIYEIIRLHTSFVTL